jgi:hypothetical protein
VSQDELMVVSFMAVYAGGFLGLLWLIDNLMQWLMDEGLVWWVAVPVGVAILMSNLGWY